MLHFGVDFECVAERFSNEFTVGKHGITANHKFVVGNKKTLIDFVFGEMRCAAIICIFEFLIALENHTFIFVRGMPDLATEKTAAVSADDFAVECLVAVSPAECFAPCYFFLHRFELLRGNNSFVRLFHIILWHLAVIDTQLFCQEVSCKAFLQQCIDFIFFVGENACNRGSPGAQDIEG